MYVCARASAPRVRAEKNSTADRAEAELVRHIFFLSRCRADSRTHIVVFHCRASPLLHSAFSSSRPSSAPPMMVLRLHCYGGFGRTMCNTMSMSHGCGYSMRRCSRDRARIRRASQRARAARRGAPLCSPAASRRSTHEHRAARSRSRQAKGRELLLGSTWSWRGRGERRGR